MNVCIDTNAYSRLWRGDQAVARFMESCDTILVPATVVGELTYGFLHGSRYRENERLLNEFLDEENIDVQPITRAIAERYGYVKAALLTKGRLIPENDMWIAATVLETGTRLVSYDTHFDEVGGLIRIAP